MKNWMNDTENVIDQYKDASKLNTRISIYDKYRKGENYSEWLYGVYTFIKECEIVEFGSGTGKDWAGKMAEVSAKYHLVMSDFSPGMVEGLKSKFGNYDNVDIMQIDIQDIPFADSTKDIAIANSMLYHVPDIDKAVSEVYRILKHGGKFYAATSGRKTLFAFFKETIPETGVKMYFPDEIPFSLMNGKKYLDKYFSDVKIEYNRGHLEITKACDLVDFIYSAASITGKNENDRQHLVEYYESMKNEKGFIEVELEYGMFVAVK